MRKWLQSVVSIFLSASVLAWTVVPPPVCHLHEGGAEASHDHSEFARQASGDDTRHCDAAYLRPDNVGDVTSLGMGDSATHHHWRFLGVEFYAPCDGDDCQNAEKSKPTLVRCNVNTATIGYGGCQGTHLIASRVPGLESIVAVVSPFRSLRVISSIPLCDSARLERSGVRLA